MSGPELCVSALLVDDDRLLLVRRGHGRAAGTWAIPGGRVERGESLAEAVVREVVEETGIEAVCGAYIGTRELIADGPHQVILTYRMDMLESTEPQAGSDATEARWVQLIDVAGLVLAPGLAEFLHDNGVIATII